MICIGIKKVYRFFLLLQKASIIFCSDKNEKYKWYEGYQHIYGDCCVCEIKRNIANKHFCVVVQSNFDNPFAAILSEKGHHKKNIYGWV